MKKYILTLKTCLFVAISFVCAEHTAQDPMLSKTLSSARPEPALISKPMTSETTAARQYQINSQDNNHEEYNHHAEPDDATLIRTTMPYRSSELEIEVDDTDNEDIIKLGHQETPKNTYYSSGQEDLEQEDQQD